MAMNAKTDAKRKTRGRPRKYAPGAAPQRVTLVYVGEEIHRVYIAARLAGLSIQQFVTQTLNEAANKAIASSNLLK